MNWASKVLFILRTKTLVIYKYYNTKHYLTKQILLIISNIYSYNITQSDVHQLFYYLFKNLILELLLLVILLLPCHNL